MIDLHGLAQYGVAGVMLGVFIWLHLDALRQARLREDRFQKKLEDMENYQRETLEVLARENVEAQRNTFAALDELREAVADLAGSNQQRRTALEKAR